MFNGFISRIRGWFIDRGMINIADQLSCKYVPLKELPPSGIHLWGSFLKTVLPDHYSYILFRERVVRESFLRNLLGFSEYIVERKIVDLIENSVLACMNFSEKKELCDKIQNFRILINEWIDSTWHQRIISDRSNALKTLTARIPFEDDWQCAAFLSETGYLVPGSKPSFIAWQRFSGKPEENTAYFEWFELLRKETPDFQQLIITDRFLDLFFSSNLSPEKNFSCERRSSCLICPLSSECRYFREEDVADMIITCEQDIKSDNVSEIKTTALLKFLAGNLWENTTVQNALINLYPDLTNTHFSDIREACDEKMLVFLLGVKELTERKRPDSAIPRGKSFRSAYDIYFHYRNIIGKKPQETFYTIILDNKHRVMANRLITQGTLNRSLVHPREVFAPALQLRSAAIILLHNHPSGDPNPSKQDLTVTQRLVEVGELVGIKVVDHVIICHTSYFSFVDENLM